MVVEKEEREGEREGGREGRTQAAYLIKEDDASLLAPGHGKELADHPRALSHIFLHQFRTDDPDEAGVRAVGHSAGGQGL